MSLLMEKASCRPVFLKKSWDQDMAGTLAHGMTLIQTTMHVLQCLT